MNTMMLQHSYNGVEILQRQTDGYINATKACKACGKLLGHYFENQTTQDFLEALSRRTGIPVKGNPVIGIPITENEFPTTGLLDIVQGGVPTLQGTWVHPYVATNLAQWANPDFAAQVAIWIAEWMNAGRPKHPDNSASQTFTAHNAREFMSSFFPPEMRGNADAPRVDEKARIIDLQTKMISMLEAENDRLKHEPETRKRITKDEERRIVAMRDAGYPVSEIADTIGRKPDTIRTVLSRHKQTA